MPTYENMYYYLEHSIREALQDLEQQNFGAAKKTLTQAREVTEKMRRVIVGKNDVYECFRNPYDLIEPAAERQRPQGADQIESRAKHCRQYFAQRVQSAYCQAFYGRVEGPRPLMCFPTAFAHTKAVPAEHRSALPRAAQREKRGYSPP